MPQITEPIGVVVVTHGQLATELLNAAQMIVGDLPQFTAVSIGWHDDAEAARRALGQAIASVDRGQGVLLLTDMFGGTPSNLGLTFLEDGRVEVVTGVNLPMLIKLARAAETRDIGHLAHDLCEHGRTAIRVASDLLRGDAGRTTQPEVVSRRVTVVNTLGMHARAAARFVRLAGRFQSRIQVSRGTRTMDGKSILGLLLLAAARGTVLDIRAEGSDEQDALEALCALTERGFEEN